MPPTLTPYVPRSLMTDLNHESSNPDRSASRNRTGNKTSPSSTVAAASSSVVAIGKRNRLANNDNRRNASSRMSSLSSPPSSAGSSRVTKDHHRLFPLNKNNHSSRSSSSGPSKRKTSLTMTTATTSQIERTASSTESSSLSNDTGNKTCNNDTNSKTIIARRRRESGLLLTPPLTCRKPMKRGRDSTGSIVHMTELTSSSSSAFKKGNHPSGDTGKVIVEEDKNDVFDLKLLDSIIDDANDSSLGDGSSEVGSDSSSSHSHSHSNGRQGTQQQEQEKYLQDLLDFSIKQDMLDDDNDDETDDDGSNGIKSLAQVVPSPADKSSSMGDSSTIRSHLMHCDFSSLISDDADNDDDHNHDGDDDDNDTMTTTESGNSWTGIMMKLGEHIHGDRGKHYQEEDIDDEEGVTFSSLSQDDDGLRHLELLLTPDIMIKDDMSAGTKSADSFHCPKEGVNNNLVEKQQCHDDTPRRRQQRSKKDRPKSFSDTECMNYVSHQKLQDILSSGGEKALDAALDALMERVDSDASDCYNNRTNSIMKNDGSDGGMGVRSFHSSFVQNGSSLDSLYLRSSLKSALIALGSVKAERRDLESNYAKLQQYCQDMKHNYEEKLKQLVDGNTNNDEKCNDDDVDTKAQLRKAHIELETQRNQLETLQSDLLKATQDRIDAMALQERVNELEIKFNLKSEENHEMSRLVDELRSNLQSKEKEEVYLKDKLEQSNNECLVLETRLAKLEDEMQRSEQHSFKKIRSLEERLYKNGQLQSETDDLMQRFDSLCTQLNSAQIELEKSNETNLSLEQKITSYQRQNEKIIKQLDEYNICCDSPTVDRVRFLIASFESSKQQLHHTESDLQDSSKKLRESLETIKKLNTEVHHLSLELDDKNYNIQKFMDLNASLAEDNKDLRERIDCINGEYAIKSLKLSEQLKELQASLTEAEDKISCINGDLRAKDSIISELQNEIDDAKEEMKSRSHQIEDLESENERIIKALQEAKEQIARLNDELVTKNVILKEIRSSSETEVEDLKVKLIESESNIISMQDRNKSDETQLHEKDVIIDNLTLELEALKASSSAEADKFVEDIDHIKLAKTRLEDKLHAKEVEINELHLNIEKLTVSLQSKDKDIKVFQSCLDEAKNELYLLREELEVYAKLGGTVTHNQQNTSSKTDVLEMEIGGVITDSTMIEIDHDEKKLKLDDSEEMKKMEERPSRELSEKDSLIVLLQKSISNLKVEMDSLKHMDESKDILDVTQEKIQNDDSAEIQVERKPGINIEHDVIEDELSIESAHNPETVLNEEESEMHELKSEIDQLRNETITLKQIIECKETEIGNLRRELKLSELNFLNSHSEVFKSQEIGDIVNVKQLKDVDAKEAVRELVDQVNAAIAEKNVALSDLKRAQNEISRMKDLCNQRELEACALESSLQKALIMADDTEKYHIVNDEMRKVIEELVNEICRFKDNLSGSVACEEWNGNIEDVSALSQELALLKHKLADQTERAILAKDSLFQHRQDYEQIVLKIDYLSNRFCQTARQSNEDTPIAKQSSESITNKLSLLSHQFEFLLDIWKEKESGASSVTVNFNCAAELESNEEHSFGKNMNTEYSKGMPVESEPFAAALNDMITHSDEVIQNALNEFSTDSSIDSEIEVKNLVTSKVPMIEYSVFESLRLKYDALMEEREELINETFALIDSSTAANLAELEAVKRRVESEASTKYTRYIEEAATRINYLETRMASYSS
mmetsp:Transcript_11097/g.20770  ORF Transcript_11097/g.20770 Transcript_11097/m.20770 type:complete len:1727 (-) Transcript_11097:594-5774(-)